MAGVTSRTFALEFCSITIGSVGAMSGFADGDALTVEFPGDDFEAQVSSDGQVIWVKKHNTVADCMLRLGQGNPLISLLRQLHEASLAAGGLTYAFTAKNLKSPDEIVTGDLMFTQRIPLKWGDTAQPAEVKFGLNVSSMLGGDITPS